MRACCVDFGSLRLFGASLSFTPAQLTRRSRLRACNSSSRRSCGSTLLIVNCSSRPTTERAFNEYLSFSSPGSREHFGAAIRPGTVSNCGGSVGGTAAFVELWEQHLRRPGADAIFPGFDGDKGLRI